MKQSELAYRPVARSEVSPALFRGFDRHQVVTQCLRRVNGAWVALDVPFVEEWGEADFAELAEQLQNTLQSGGLLMGAFQDGALKGFASVEGAPMGHGYLELSNLHVSCELRGQGAGRRLFAEAAAWAKAHGARKLYLSAHSSVESQAFYAAMGCVDAAHPDAAHVAKEPCDRQLELTL